MTIFWKGNIGFMVSCNDLLKLDIFDNIRLVAGKGGIYKSISWTYICQTLDFSQWVNGGELMFLTGMGMNLDDEKIIDLIYECEKKEISGLVLLTGSEYIKTISENVKRVADKVDLPLFDMPWYIKLIDVNKDIANFMMNLTLNRNKEREFLRELLFSKDLNKEKIGNLISYTKLNIDKKVFVCNFVLLKENEFGNLSIKHIINMLKSKIQKINLNVVLDTCNNQVICIVELREKDDFNEVKKDLICIYENISEYIDTCFTIGGLAKNVFYAKQSYIESMKSFKLYEGNNWDLNVIDYEELGFYKVLFEVNNINKLREYSYEVLGKIIDRDKNGDLLKTLRYYLRNNCNLINTSKEMYIHRNTLIYRLNKIKILLNHNLEDQAVRNELMSAIMIYDYLKVF